MKENEIIACASTQDMLIKAAQLSAVGIQTEMIGNCQLRIVDR